MALVARGCCRAPLCLVLAVLLGPGPARSAREMAELRTLGTDMGEEAAGAGAAFIGDFPSWPCLNPEFFLDGSEYFPSVYHAVEALGEGSEVIVTGWKYEPEKFYLLGNLVEESRMDKWLLRAAERGVRIHVQFWYNAMNPTKKELFAHFHVGRRSRAFAALHENIHPFVDSGRGATWALYWSWHMKAVVINRKTLYVGGFDFTTIRWDTPQHLRPDPRRGAGEKGWIDVAMRLEGDVALDVANALIARHHSFCESTPNVAQRALLQQTVLKAYDQCKLENRPTVNPAHADPVGTCATMSCFDRHTTCVNGKCVCQDGFRPEAGGKFCAQLPRSVAAALDTCRALLTASSYFMDTRTANAPEIYTAFLEAIRASKRSIMISNQYFIGSRGKCSLTCPKNRVVIAIAERLERAIDAGEDFSFVLFLAGKTAASHMPTLKTLFQEDKKGAGLKTRLMAYLEKKGRPAGDWRKYLAIAHACNAVTPEHLQEQFKLAGVTQPATAEMPELGSASFYPIFIHSKALAVDGEVVQVGSANINDRSLRGTGSNDAELNVEIKGPAARTFMQAELARFTGQSSLDEAGLALRVNEIAEQNNELLASWFGVDFLKGEDRRSGQPLFTGKGTPGFFQAMDGGEPMMRPVDGPRPAFQGWIFPWTEKIWGDVNSQSWLTNMNTNALTKEVVN